ncbi:NAD(P)-dependent iron-only hydrogenase diaphorase component flavoprotein [Acetitomaculum ruminis DSM 5522]|uniref:NAD(P)-dependent iron-only hydrogenase diaphorase component flavoprotein n=1 Tax=Acetitomaculum ruminis DSM 5522 TaxID=1120918 RepID=A0A1I0UY92_9FIRM|nr:NADH-quinone oxidoreductase subunit NuoF [Acetitomaculum ruminis]SFA69021.1 NAD(P)-dependent iron-only hydrogenase diaphorase component flavoprotein [Acetitomaculum ruminis DSM 5522]
MKSLEELNAIRDQYRGIVEFRDEEAVKSGTEKISDKYEKQILVCGGTGCTSSGSKKIIDKFHEELKARGMDEKINIVMTGCHGLCALGPIVIVYPDACFYSRISADDIPEIVEEHLVKGNIVKKFLYEETIVGDDIRSLHETDFYKHQHRVALRNCGVINPEIIEEYIARDGYQALHKVLTELKPEDVIQILLDSGLRGRGGAGFPTGMKWKFAMGNKADQKYVCCNADEGDPGAFMDRSVLEGDPHVVLEAMTIAGYTIGANQGYIYVRAEYPIAIERLNIAIKQAREAGMLGKDIFGTGFDFDIDLRLGAGAFVCGEETALMTSIEGNRGEPHPRPPFPAVKGLFQKPTILNNVETWANIPRIILQGAEWFASMGTEKSKGTKVFALGGKINNVGLVEIPMGTTLRTIIEEIGGGIPGGKKFKAAQTGGPSGGCIPASLIDTPIDYNNLLEIGSMMGSGGLIVMDETDCMVDIAKFFLEFTVDESCGKCAPCRIGTKRLLELLNLITSGKATMDDLDRLEKLTKTISQNSLCALGQTASNPVISTLRYFKDEYIAHIVDKKCPAGKCKDLISYYIDPDKCIGCGLCKKNCPADAITGEKKQPHEIDTMKCIKCGTCIDKCKKDAIYKK